MDPDYNSPLGYCWGYCNLSINFLRFIRIGMNGDESGFPINPTNPEKQFIFRWKIENKKVTGKRNF